MDTIVALKNESLDNIVLQCRKDGLEEISNSLEKMDKNLASELNRKRFVLIRKSERKILSSLGIISFKRRYYYDKWNEEYIYPLDNVLGIPKSSRITNELRLKVLNLSTMMTYTQTGQNLCDDFWISKSTVYRILHDTIIEQCFVDEIKREGLKVHVQIDEKFIGMVDGVNKKRYYTCTIFAGKVCIKVLKNGKRIYKLLNKTVLSSAKLSILKERINYHLKERYKVSPDEEIFLSGDYANYIQNFKYDIFECKAKYVPDKFHTFRAIDGAIENFKVNEKIINDPAWQKFIISKLEELDEKNNKYKDSSKVLKMLKRNPEIFKTYLDKEYLGCSQEAQNSHIYAPRFGKYANRFCPETIEKLSLVLEAKENKAKIIVSSLGRKIQERVDIFPPDLTILAEETRYDLDTTQMKNDTWKYFNLLKYGE